MSNTAMGESVSFHSAFTYCKLLLRTPLFLNFMVMFKEMLNTCTGLEKLLIVLGKNGVTAKN